MDYGIILAISALSLAVSTVLLINIIKTGKYSKKIYEHLKSMEEKNKSSKEGKEMVDELMKKVG